MNYTQHFLAVFMVLIFVSAGMGLVMKGEVTPEVREQFLRAQGSNMRPVSYTTSPIDSESYKYFYRNLKFLRRSGSVYTGIGIPAMPWVF